MAAVAAGSLVIPSASIAGALIHRTPAKKGVVQAVGGAGPPPTGVLVDWQDGTQTTYAVVNQSTSSVILQLLATTQPDIVGSFVNPTGNNPGQSRSGQVIEQWSVTDPSGNVLSELVLVKCALGYYWAPYSAVVVDPTR